MYDLPPAGLDPIRCAADPSIHGRVTATWVCGKDVLERLTAVGLDDIRFPVVDDARQGHGYTGIDLQTRKEPLVGSQYPDRRLERDCDAVGLAKCSDALFDAESGKRSREIGCENASTSPLAVDDDVKQPEVAMSQGSLTPPTCSDQR
jgi:hypothetical protein